MIKFNFENIVTYLDGHSERPGFVVRFFRWTPPTAAAASFGVQIDGFFVDQDLASDHALLDEPIPGFL